MKFLLLEEVITQANEILADEDAHTETGAELLKTPNAEPAGHRLRGLLP